jgi:small subunit ribosomal protein S9
MTERNRDETPEPAAQEPEAVEPEATEPEATEPEATEPGEAVPAAEQAEPGEGPGAVDDEAPAAEGAEEQQEAPAAEEPAAEEPAAEEQEPEEEQEPQQEEAAPRKLVELGADARYFATGKRKSSVARVILRPGSGTFDLNGRSLEAYFPRRKHQAVVREPLEIAGYMERVDVRARIHGGGIGGQADAVKHGIAKALIEADPGLRVELKRRQLLTRDPRVKERRKAGLKKARKRPQFSKR